VTYGYDSSSRPAVVTYSSGAGIVYGYDVANFLTTIESPPGNQVLSVSYDARYNATRLTLAGGSDYSV